MLFILTMSGIAGFNFVKKEKEKVTKKTCVYAETDKWFSEIGPSKKETKSDLEKMEEELDENGEQKWHVLDDSDLMSGGEV